MQILSEMLSSNSRPNLVAMRTLFSSTARIVDIRMLLKAMVHLSNPAHVILVSA